MEELSRPPLGDDVYEEIELAQIQVDETFWPQLRELVVSHIESPTRGTPPLRRRPMRLRRILREYACALFDVEAKRYPASHELELWLRELAARIETRTMHAAALHQMSVSRVTLTYHASEKQMRHAIRVALQLQIASHQSRALPGRQSLSGVTIAASQAKDASATGREPGQRRLRSTICSLPAAKRMEAYLEAEGIGLTEFAIQANTTDRTLRSFRKTGRVRRDIFDNIAKAMATTRGGLLKA